MRTVKVFKYDGSLHYEWTSQVIEVNKEYILLYGAPGRSLRHHTRNARYVYDSHSIECFMLNEGFTCQLEYKNGEGVRYYSNIGTVPRLERHEIHFTDLDIDIISNYSNEWSIVDEEEFESNRIHYHYSEQIISHVEETIDKVMTRIRDQQFPFDGSLEKRIIDLANSKK